MFRCMTFAILTAMFTLSAAGAEQDYCRFMDDSETTCARIWRPLHEPRFR